MDDLKAFLTVLGTAERVHKTEKRNAAAVGMA